MRRRVSTERSGEERRQELLRLVRENPLLTDEELGRALGVSVPTVRLDRLRLGVPPQPERARQLAGVALGDLRSLSEADVVGDLVEVERGRRARSLLRTSPRLAFLNRNLIRGHHLFGQANSLAVAVVDADEVVTASARVRFLRPVYVGAVVEAEAKVRQVRRGPREKWWVDVESRVGSEPVLRGSFLLAVLDRARGTDTGAGVDPKTRG
ncbi:MAG TPA: transcription factor FapR [Firmicutes bacterium]|nr:transcription factor FapR [Bacillota bacterium]